MDWTRIELGSVSGYFTGKELFFGVDYETVFFDILYPIDIFHSPLRVFVSVPRVIVVFPGYCEIECPVPTGQNMLNLVENGSLRNDRHTIVLSVQVFNTDGEPVVVIPTRQQASIERLLYYLGSNYPTLLFDACIDCTATHRENLPDVPL